MRPKVTMRRAITDPALLGWVMAEESWAAWRTVLIATFGEKLTEPECAIWRELTGRDREPGAPAEEALWLVGRRGGKSRAASVAISYVAGLCDWSDVLVPGERGIASVMSATQRQAAIIHGYTAAIFERSPLLSALVQSQSSDTLSLTNQVDVEIKAASFRSTRGVTSIAVVGDEVAFWPSSDSANADSEILAALRPSLATTGGPLILVTSPYARRGEAYEIHKRHYGPAGDPQVVVVQAPSRKTNPSLPQSLVDRALERDPFAARAEYLAEFRTDVEQLLTIEAVEACVEPGATVRPHTLAEGRFAFCDFSGGSSDSATLAIARREGRRAVLEHVIEVRPPFSPEDVARTFAQNIKAYGLTEVHGDAYAGLWPRERMAVHGIAYKVADKTRTALYQSLVAAVNSGAVSLLDNARLTAQLVALERRTTRGGREQIDHPPGGHDDLANAVAGAVERCLDQPAPYDGPLWGTYSLHEPQRPVSDPLPPPSWMLEPGNEAALQRYLARQSR